MPCHPHLSWTALRGTALQCNSLEPAIFHPSTLPVHKAWPTKRSKRQAKRNKAKLNPKEQKVRMPHASIPL